MGVTATFLGKRRLKKLPASTPADKIAAALAQGKVDRDEAQAQERLNAAYWRDIAAKAKELEQLPWDVHPEVSAAAAGRPVTGWSAV